ncbi:MAG TPA: thioredoxin fold domain-containing protein [Noviherbaspirillum sp.]|uniref:thioredoxin family protein n=1 Tax=Noviherbaspirillum sp. TaxID=1926288 RepID=UPI002B491D84|nr:thioredoxin fold domain-containing protein [Noviherbaspirillum sp.]HJV85283.1 thioredoxin fold domain-containing protein [Noviherbaspirillum sp.]
MISRAWLVKLVFGAAILPAFAGLVFLLSSASSATASNAGMLPAPVDLGQDGRIAGMRSKPLVVMFSLPGCSFCNVVRRNYLAPLLRDLPESQRPVIREVEVNGSDTLFDFKHERISQNAFAQRYGVRFAPTVIMLDRAGNLLTAPIVGGDTAGLYGGYLDNAFAEAGRKLAAARLAETLGEKQ